MSVVGGDKITCDVNTAATVSDTQLTLSSSCLKVTVKNTLDQIKCLTYSLHPLNIFIFLGKFCRLLVWTVYSILNYVFFKYFLSHSTGIMKNSSQSLNFCAWFFFFQLFNLKHTSFLFHDCVNAGLRADGGNAWKWLHGSSLPCSPRRRERRSETQRLCPRTRGTRCWAAAPVRRRGAWRRPDFQGTAGATPAPAWSSLKAEATSQREWRAI